MQKDKGGGEEEREGGDREKWWAGKGTRDRVGEKERENGGGRGHLIQLPQ